MQQRRSNALVTCAVADSYVSGARGLRPLDWIGTFEIYSEQKENVR